METACTKLRATEEQLVQTREEHQRYVMEREADAMANAAAALHDKTRELAEQKEALDRCQTCELLELILQIAQMISACY